MKLIIKGWFFVKNIFERKEGQGMVEYGLIIALIAAVVVGLVATLGEDIKYWFQQIIDEISPPTTTP